MKLHALYNRGRWGALADGDGLHQSWPAWNNPVESTTKNAILRILIGAILFSLITGIAVSIIGLRLGWKASTQFSDGFFLAGVVMLSIGFISFRGYSQRTTAWPPINLNPADSGKLWAADVLHGKMLMAVFGISGLLLFGLSALVSRLSWPAVR